MQTAVWACLLWFDWSQCQQSYHNTQTRNQFCLDRNDDCETPDWAPNQSSGSGMWWFFWESNETKTKTKNFIVKQRKFIAEVWLWLWSWLWLRCVRVEKQVLAAPNVITCIRVMSKSIGIPESTIFSNMKQWNNSSSGSVFNGIQFGGMHDDWQLWMKLAVVIHLLPSSLKSQLLIFISLPLFSFCRCHHLVCAWIGQKHQLIQRFKKILQNYVKAAV